MRKLTISFIAASVCALGTGSAAIAQSSNGSQRAEGEPLSQTLQMMQEELAKLRNDNESMRGQIDELRAKSDADWLTEARADQIKGLVQDVLADADSRANLLNNGIMAGWDEHFFLADAFGRFLLRVEGLMQIRFLYNYRNEALPAAVPDKHRMGFENTRTHLTFRGHVYDEDIQYLIRGDFARAGSGTLGPGAFNLLDAWIRYNLDNNWSVRVGQFKLPFSREQLVYAGEQLAVERSEVSEINGIGRSQGIELAYHDSANALSVVFSDGMSSRGVVLSGLMGGPRTNTAALTTDTEWAVTSRYERLLAGTWNQFRDFTSPIDEEFGMLFGIAIHAQQGESTGTPFVGTNEARSFGVTSDFSVEWGGANAFVAVYYHYVDHPTAQIFDLMGIVAQVGVYIAPKWEIFARAEWAQIENRSGGTFNGSDFGMGTIGFNYYIEGHDVKWTSDLGFTFTPVAGSWVVSAQSSPDGDITGLRALGAHEPQLVFRTQIQIGF